MLKLYFGKFSPYTRKVRILLAEREIPHETLPTDVSAPPPEFLAANPNGRIPTIEDGGRVLFESNVILEYLLQAYPPQGSGQPPLGRKLVRPENRWEDEAVLAVIETVLDSGLNLFQLGRDGIEPAKAPYLQAEQARIQRDLDWLEERITPEGFVPGEFSILDLNLVCALEWAEFRNPFQWRGRPKLERTMAFHAQRESIRTTRPGS